jgi:hypothetical protein
MDGYIILGPGHPPETGRHTFGLTAVEAWSRHIGGWEQRDIGERETLVRRWSQKGWRPVKARLEIIES